MKHRTTHSSHDRKVLFDRILSKDLAVCKYKIKAFYKWENSAQIFSFRFLDEKNIEVGINLNIDKDLFSSSPYSRELDICYRSYFIANYLRCLEGAEDTIPCSLFQGLVVLESVNDIHTQGIIDVYSPLPATKKSRVRPINIHCAIRALTRILIEQKEVVTPHVQIQCERSIDWMVAYTRLPEVMYGKSRKPKYALFNDLVILKKLLDKHQVTTERYPIFASYGILNFDDQTINELLERGLSSRFWNDVIIRIIACSGGMRSVIDVTTLPEIRESVLAFWEESLSCYQESRTSKNVILDDNLLAIKKMSKKIGQSFSLRGTVGSGALHFIQ